MILLRRCFHHFVFLILLLAGSSARAKDIPQCFLDYLNDTVLVDSWIGHTSGIDELLHGAKVPRETSQAVLSEMRKIVRAPRASNERLLEVVRAMKASEGKPEALSFCFTADTCDPVKMNATHKTTQTSYHLKDFEHVASSRNPNVAGQYVKKNPNTNPVRSSLVVIPTKGASAPELVQMYYHQASQYTDHDLIDRWVSANQKLIKEGKEPDVLFKKYAETDQSDVYLDHGFYRLFLESRATEVEYQAALVIASRAPAYTATQQAYLLADKKMLALTRMGDTNPEYPVYANLTRPQLSNKYGIDFDNVFKSADHYGKQMEETIRKANETQAH